MAADDTYDDLLDGTVSDVKEDLGDYSRSELRDILEAEKQGDDRKTLKEAIRKRMQDLEDEATAAEEATPPAASTGETVALQNSRKSLGVGLVLGVIVTVAAALFVPQVQGAIVQSSPVASGSGSADTDAIRENVQSLMDQQTQRQRQQFSLIANQSENISASDLSISASVTSVEPSEFGSLQAVTVSITGTVPSRTGGLRQLDQEQTLYVSSDGRYLFPQPTDMENPQQQQPQPTP